MGFASMIKKTVTAVAAAPAATEEAARRGLPAARPGYFWTYDAGGNLVEYKKDQTSGGVIGAINKGVKSTLGAAAKIPAVQTVAKIAAGAAVTVAAGAVGVAVAGALGGTAGAAALKEAKKAVDEAKEKGEDVAKAVEMPVQLRPNIATPKPPPAAAVDALFKDPGTAVQVPYKRPEAEQYAPGVALPADSPGTVPAGTPRQLDFLEQIFAGIAKLLNIG